MGGREENILCLPPFFGGALITVHVKLKMSEISRAAGVVGGDNREEAGPGKSL